MRRLLLSNLVNCEAIKRNLVQRSWFDIRRIGGGWSLTGIENDSNKLVVF